MRFFCLMLLTMASTLIAATGIKLDEAQVFEWWDNGIIGGDESREILELLEEGNLQEACMLAEVYALESCASDETPKLKKTKTKRKEANARPKKSKSEQQPSLVPHGHIEWRGRTDSLGHLESGRTEVRLNFYRYSLRLGTQSLLTYKNAGSEAHFGQISTKELHSAIPLDTLWGTALLYPIGMFQIGAFLDTARTSRFNAGIIAQKNLEIGFAYWHHLLYADSIEHRSVTAQANGNWGNAAVWWIPGNSDMPLMKLQLQHREKMEYATIAWKTSAYMHGDSLPEESRLSPTIAKSRFWGSQTIDVTTHDAWKSKWAVNARSMIPLEGDSSKTRFKASAESGPEILRTAASATCLSGEDRCRQNDWALKIRSTWNLESEKSAHEQFVFSGKVRARHTRGEGFSTPLYEAGIAYAQNASNNASIAITVPKGTPSKEIQLRSSTEIGTDFLLLSLAVTFRRTAEEAFHPLHAAMKARINF